MTTDRIIYEYACVTEYESLLRFRTGLYICNQAGQIHHDTCPNTLSQSSSTGADGVGVRRFAPLHARCLSPMLEDSTPPPPPPPTPSEPGFDLYHLQASTISIGWSICPLPSFQPPPHTHTTVPKSLPLPPPPPPNDSTLSIYYQCEPICTTPSFQPQPPPHTHTSVPIQPPPPPPSPRILQQLSTSHLLSVSNNLHHCHHVSSHHHTPIHQYPHSHPPSSPPPGFYSSYLQAIYYQYQTVYTTVTMFPATTTHPYISTHTAPPPPPPSPQDSTAAIYKPFTISINPSVRPPPCFQPPPPPPTPIHQYPHSPHAYRADRQRFHRTSSISVTAGRDPSSSQHNRCKHAVSTQMV